MLMFITNFLLLICQSKNIDFTFDLKNIYLKGFLIQFEVKYGLK